MKILYLPLLTLLMSFISLDVYAYDIEVTNDQGVTIYYNYIKDNTELEVCYGEESYSGSVVIPEKVIYQNKSYCVTSIGEYAFNGCTGLISVSIPNNLISIGEYAFMNCESLTSISIPNSVVYIGEWAFGSSGLTSITIPNSVTSICDGAFSYCTGLTSITIPNSVTSIGEYAFYGCSGLISITIPQSVTSIRESAFLGCGALTTITINSCEISIGENTFMNCTSVTDVYCYTEPAKIEWQGHFFPSSFVKFHVFDKTSYETKFPNAGVDFDEGLRTIVCNGITYEIISTIDKTAKVIADKEGYKGDIEMAASIVSNNVTYSVVAIDEKAFSDCSDLTSVSIPNSVTSIGSEAFLECTGLTSLTIPNSVVSIGREAFRNCFGLTSITIPNSVTSIGEYAFDWCENLTSVTLSSNLTTIEEGLFIDCTSLSSITIPSSVTSIWDNAFYGCDALESIIVEEGNDVYDSRENCNAIIKSETNRLVFGCKNTVIPNTVVTIGQLAFKNCSGLTSIVIPNSVISIEEEAFAWCSDLISVTIGSGVTSIKNNAFAFCHKLEKVIISDISAWCAISFENGDSNPLCRARHLYSDENTEITNLEIPSGVTSIGSYAFLNCEGLTSLNIPSGVTSVSNNAFYGCKNLVTMTINSSEISIAENVFMNCGSITDVYCYTESEKMEWAGRFFPSKGFVKFHVFDKAAYVTKFPNAAVSFDDGLRTIVNEGITYKIISTTDKTAQVVAGKEKYEGDIIIPASVVSDNNVTYSVVAIGDNAFSQCSDLISVTIPNSVTSIGESAFYSSGITSITIPNNVCSLGESVFDDCSGLVSVVIPNSVTSISNYAFSRCRNLTSVTIPNSVTSIGENAFYECSSLASVTIPNSVISIGAGAFNWSGLTSVSIPNSVTSMGEFAFGSCENLKKVIVPDISAWCSIDFENESSNPLCYGHHIYSDEDTEMTKLDIPSGVTSINKYAFYNCESLTSVTIPNSVSSIGNDAFHNCDNMTSLTINSDVISIVQDAFKESSSVTEVYCYTTPENMEWTGWFFPSSYDVKFHVFDKAAYEAKFPNAGVEFDERLLVYEGVVYKIISTTDKTAKVIPNEEGYKGDIEIASSFVCNDVAYSVVAIDDKAFYDCDELTSVIIPTSVKSIGYQAFLNCNRMTSITIPDGITSIEDGTFASCNSLTSIVIPNSVKSIGNWAFESCGFQSLTIGNNVESIGSYAFTGCSSLVSITISNNITSISEGTFSNCSNLTSFVMPDNITSIGEQAFYNCSSLTSIVIPNGVTSVESFAFLNCENLTSIEIPSSVIFLGAGAFSGCKNLTTISINSSKISISENSFSSCQNIETITISSSEISFAENVFMSCSSIADVYCYTEPEKVEWQGRFFPSKAFVKFHVFDKAPYETKFPNAGVIFDDGLRTIVSDGITYEIISTTDKTAKVIAGEEGYKGDIEIATSFDCNNVVFSVVAIDKEAFSGCSDLTSVIIPNSVTSIGEHAFDNCIALESIIVEEGNDVYDSRNNCNAIIETGTNKLLYGCKNTVIPNSVLTIGQSAFSGCSKLTSIDIPNSVTSIEENAFSSCSNLISVTIGNGVTSIEEEAFDCCSNLISVTIGSGVTSIKNNAFAFCHKLEKVIVSDISAWCAISFENEDSNPLYHANHLYCDENTEITNLEIPSGVSSISKHAFQNCEGLRSLVIPNSVTSISEDAFTGCRNIVTMTINSSEISIVENVFMSCTSIADVFCYTEPEKVEWQGRFFPSKSFVKFHVFDKAPYETKFPNAGVTFCSFSGLCYEVISEIDKTAKVVEDTKKYKGDIEIASSCVIDGVTYSVIEIGNYAFYECGDLTSITIPHSVTSIGNSAFKGCGGLVSIKVEDGNPKYDSRYDCNAIIETSSNKLILGSKNTVIPNSVTIIGSNAFRGCNGLTSVTIPNSVIFISDHAFEYCSDLSSITIGNSVDYIGTGIFNNCSNLTSIKVESGNLKYDSRDDCNAIIETSSNTLIKGCKGTIIPNSVTAIGNSAFEHNTGMTSMIIPNSVTSIGSAAFCHCSRLTSITIPNSVTSIGDYAFDGCDGLTSVTVNMDQPVSISEGVFPNRANATLYVPAGSKAAYQAAAYWNDFKEIVEIGMDLPADELFSGTNLWAGYVAQEDLIPGTGLKVYVITNLGTTTATVSQIDYMPQGVPVLLRREDTAVSSYEVTSGTGTAQTKNLLRVFDTDRSVSNREGFILYNDEFVLVNEGVLPAGRVFLPANNLQMSRGLTRSIVIDDDDATGIEDLEESLAVEEPYDVYDLSGRKVANQVTSLDGLPHGIYIVNGKKILKR